MAKTSLAKIKSQLGVILTGNTKNNNNLQQTSHKWYKLHCNIYIRCASCRETSDNEYPWLFRVNSKQEKFINETKNRI